MESIFPVDNGLEVLNKYLGSVPSPISSTIIIGPTRSCKTTLLMQAAVTEGDTGGQVLFVAPKKFSKLPPSVHGMPTPSSSSMNNIRFLYASDSTELHKYLASLHMIPAKDCPTLIVIDELQMYSTPQECSDAATQRVNAARILSFAQESAMFCSTLAHGKGESFMKQCSVLTAWTHRSSDLQKLPELETFFKDFCRNVWTLHLNKKSKMGDALEYTLVQNLTSESVCKIIFSSHSTSRHCQYILLREVVMEELEDGPNEEEERIEAHHGIKLEM